MNLYEVAVFAEEPINRAAYRVSEVNITFFHILMISNFAVLRIGHNLVATTAVVHVFAGVCTQVAWPIINREWLIFLTEIAKYF